MTMMWGAGWFGGAFVIICLALMVWMMMGHGMTGLHGHGNNEAGSGDTKRNSADAGEILAERFARGEISEEEFEQRKRVLENRPS
jgi:putative membrane protein